MWDVHLRGLIARAISLSSISLQRSASKGKFVAWTVSTITQPYLTYSTSPLKMSQHILSHYDPAVLELQNALKVARSSGASPEVIKSIEMSLELVKLREDFTHHGTSKESDVCKNIVEETYKHDWEGVHKEGKTSWQLKPMMLSGPLEGQFLKSVISGQKAKRVLDIGMYTGYSALSMAEALPADGEVVTIDMNGYLKDLVTNLVSGSPHHKKIKIRIGKAKELLKQMVDNGEKFDIMFLDADKSEYPDYLKFAFQEGLLKPGGTVLVDNAYRHGDGYIPGRGNTTTKMFLDSVAADASLHKVLVPIRDGILMIRRLSEVEGTV